MKNLNELSAEELGILFPIEISEYNPEWKKLFENEKEHLKKHISQKDILRITHIGSTSVPGMKAKPTIDILIEIDKQTDTSELIQRIIRAGYNYSHQPGNPPPHMMFMKGYTLQGFKGQAFHLHIRYMGDWDEVYFRDYLIKNPLICREYENLKLSLEKLYKNDREAYTKGKTDFVKKITSIARSIKNNPEIFHRIIFYYINLLKTSSIFLK